MSESLGPARPFSRAAKLVWVLLIITAAFWIPLALTLLRIHPIYLWIEKTLGSTSTRAILVLCPLVAGIVSLRMARNRSRWMGMTLATLFLAAFMAAVGVPLIVKAMEPKRPENPQSPRPLVAESGIPAFPGAEGFGTRTPAGRGGKVYAVTSLADDGPGTLRDALQQKGPITIVFRVGGMIELESPLYISHPFVTIAGQTAPGDGICIKNAGLTILTHDVLVQHLRIRPGNEGKVTPDDNDGISILGAHGTGGGGAHHVVIDHCSISWSEDEAVSTWFAPHDVTISWCVISEALDRSRHRKGTHSAGLLIGDSSEHVTVHHTLLAHNSFRNPLIAGGGTHEVVNNVVYDWKEIPGEIFDLKSNTFLNFIGNTYIAGPSVVNGARELMINPGKDKGVAKVYVEGNIGPFRSQPGRDEWETVGYGWSGKAADPQGRADKPFPTRGVTAADAATAAREVLARAGASLPERDAVDRRIVQEVEQRKGRIINSPADVGGYPRLHSAVAPADSDRDGMPDDWETKLGLNPGDPADGNRDRNGDGYTNLEEYLHSLNSQGPGR